MGSRQSHEPYLLLKDFGLAKDQLLCTRMYSFFLALLIFIQLWVSQISTFSLLQSILCSSVRFCHSSTNHLTAIISLCIIYIGISYFTDQRISLFIKQSCWIHHCNLPFLCHLQSFDA